MIGAAELVSDDGLVVDPREARVDASTLCQLACATCPVNERHGRPFVGRGVLSVASFGRFLDANPQVRVVELGNSGEVFLNPRLPELFRAARERGVAVRIAEGANLNDASSEALEALVLCGVTVLRVPVDGVTQQTYGTYRVGGELRKVLANVRRINEYKRKHGSDRPRLVLQFIPFGHNEDEMEKAVVLARMLGMDVEFKLNTYPEVFPLRDKAAVARRLGYADKDSYLEATGRVYMRDVCLQLWRAPQVNWDGRLLGCSTNVWAAYAEDTLGPSFVDDVNNERMRYARRMLMGQAPPREDVPCSRCESYADYLRHDQWFRPEEIRAAMRRESL